MTSTTPFSRTCPSCHGAGGETEVLMDDGTGPWEICGPCDGAGTITDRHLYYRVLGWQSAYKRNERKLREARAKH